MLNKETDQTVFDGTVGLIAHGEIHPGLFIYNTAGVAEFLKADLSVVSAHTTATYTPKGHFAGGKMDHSIIDTAAAETAFGEYLLLQGTVRGYINRRP